MLIFVKTSGSVSSPKVAFDTSEIATAIQESISGSPFYGDRISLITHEFLERHSIVARYHSGAFLGFSISDSAMEEFESIPKEK